jgi:hypothetical protein
VRFSTDQLELVDTSLTTAELSFMEGFLASVDAENLRTTRCGNLAAALVGIRGEASQLGPCDSLIFHASSMDSGLLDGNVHAESSRLQSVYIGKRAPTTLDAWEGSIDRARFCEHAGLLRFSAAQVVCSSCEEASSLSSCFFEAPPLLLRNPCLQLQNGAPACQGPVPESSYPR